MPTRKWLTWYFERCVVAGGKIPVDIKEFLPWNLSDEKKKELRDTGPAGRDDPNRVSQESRGRRSSMTTQERMIRLGLRMRSGVRRLGPNRLRW